MRRLIRIVLVTALAMVLGVLLTCTPVLADGEIGVIVDNLQYEASDFRSSPVFKCMQMSSMANHFFESAGYDCQCRVGFGGAAPAHTWLESDAFGSMYYESTYKEFWSKTILDRYPTQSTWSGTDSWITWYDWKWTRGDINDDGIVNIFDFVLFAGAYDTDVTEASYEMLGDMDLDGDIDIYDFVHFAAVYQQHTGQSCPSL